MEANLAVETTKKIVFFNNEILIDSTVGFFFNVYRKCYINIYFLVRWKQQPKNTDWWKVSMELAR